MLIFSFFCFYLCFFLFFFFFSSLQHSSATLLCFLFDRAHANSKLLQTHKLLQLLVLQLTRTCCCSCFGRGGNHTASVGQWLLLHALEEAASREEPEESQHRRL